MWWKWLERYVGFGFNYGVIISVYFGAQNRSVKEGIRSDLRICTGSVIDLVLWVLEAVKRWVVLGFLSYGFLGY